MVTFVSVLAGAIGVLVTYGTTTRTAAAAVERDSHWYWVLGLVGLMPAWLIAFVGLLPTARTVGFPSFRLPRGSSRRPPVSSV